MRRRRFGGAVPVEHGPQGPQGIQGPPGAPGAQGPAGSPGPNLLAPHDPRLCNSITAFSVANQFFGQRVLVPKTGTIHDFAIFVGAAAGHVLGAIYDTSATTRNLLWSSGSFAPAGSNSWQVLGDPGLAVNAGDQLDLAIMADTTTTLTVARSPNPAAVNLTALPASYWPSPLGGKPTLAWVWNVGSFTAPATVAETSLATNTGNFWFSMARVA